MTRPVEPGARRTAAMGRCSGALVLAALGCMLPRVSLAEPIPSVAEAPSEDEAARTGLGFRIRGGAIHSFDADLNTGGSFDTTRAVAEGSVRYAFSETRFVGLAVGYNWDGYGFSPGAQIGGQDPWNQVQTLRLSAPIFWDFEERWRTLAIPILRLTAEDASDWGDGVTGGGIVGFSYRFGKRLRIGPGVGVLSQIGAGVSVFPVIVVDWQVTDRLRIETGRSLGATEGPGLVASYAFRPWLKASIGFRYEKLRFRLEKNQTARGRIGQDQNFPVLAGLTLGYPFAQLTVFAGAKVAGKLKIYEPDGTKLAESSYDAAATVGGTFQLLF